jgi:hypothetical protein
MIWESYYWKKDILNYSKRLKKRKEQRKWFDESFANTEKDIMLSAFMIRKLFDSDKIDKRIENKEIQVVIFKSNGKKINKLKTIFQERYFELEKPNQSKLKLREICNQIIHSYIFSLITNEEQKLKSFWVASDYNKFKHLIEISIDNYVNILNLIGSYWPINEHYLFDNKKGDFIVYHDLIIEKTTILDDIYFNKKIK